jgi:hypothetical protein
MCKVTLWHVCATTVAVGEKNYIKKIVSICLSVALHIQHAMRVPHTVICGLPCFTKFFHNISQMTRFYLKKKVTENECVF